MSDLADLKYFIHLSIINTKISKQNTSVTDR